jgi:hypothetical protein
VHVTAENISSFIYDLLGYILVDTSSSPNLGGPTARRQSDRLF